MKNFYKNILPQYLAIGVSEERVLDGTPNDLKPFSDAYQLKCEELDRQAWMNNQYTLAAIMHGLSRLSKKGGKIDYPDKPFLEEMAKKRKEEHLTEKEMSNEREQLLMKLQLMMSNFNRTHKENQGEQVS